MQGYWLALRGLGLKTEPNAPTQPDKTHESFICLPGEELEEAAAAAGLSAVGEGELQQSLCVHLVEEFELCGQLMGLLPFGGELGALLVIVVVRQLFACVRVPAKGPEAVQVDLVAHGGRQRVHQDAGAQAFRRQLLGFPVAVEYK